MGISRVYHKMFSLRNLNQTNGTVWCYGYINGGVLQFGVWWPRKIQFWLAGASRKYFKVLLNTSRSEICSLVDFLKLLIINFSFLF